MLEIQLIHVLSSSPPPGNTPLLDHFARYQCHQSQQVLQTYRCQGAVGGAGIIIKQYQHVNMSVKQTVVRIWGLKLIMRDCY